MASTDALKQAMAEGMTAAADISATTNAMAGDPRYAAPKPAETTNAMEGDPRYAAPIDPETVGDRGPVTKESYGYVLNDQYAGLTESQINSYDHIPDTAARNGYKRSALQPYADNYQQLYAANPYAEGTPEAEAYTAIMYMQGMQDPIYVNYMSTQDDFQTQMMSYEMYLESHTCISDGIYGMSDADWEAYQSSHSAEEITAFKQSMSDVYATVDKNAHAVWYGHEVETPTAENGQPTAEDENVVSADDMREMLTSEDMGFVYENGHYSYPCDPCAGFTEAQLAEVEGLTGDEKEAKITEIYQGIADQWAQFDSNCPTESPDKEMFMLMSDAYKLKDPGYVNYMQRTGQLDAAVQNSIDSSTAFAESLDVQTLSTEAGKAEYEAMADRVGRLMEEKAVECMPDRADMLDMTGGSNLDGALDGVEQEGISGEAEPQSELSGDDATSTDSEEKSSSSFESLKGGAAAFFSGMRSFVEKLPGGTLVLKGVDFLVDKAVEIYNKLKGNDKSDEAEASHDNRVAEAEAMADSVTAETPAPEAETEVSAEG